MFKKEMFDYHCGYLTYEENNLARIKYVTYEGSYKNMLIKQFTPRA